MPSFRSCFTHSLLQSSIAFLLLLCAHCRCCAAELLFVPSNPPQPPLLQHLLPLPTSLLL
eukprot:m.254965 g.254965  ORF g.254965 m.254965 type:complete len:60 (-) comp11009_c1_seq16:12-191(-)